MHVFNHIKRNKPPWINSKRNANLQELIHTQFALSLEHIPKSFSVNANTTGKLRNAHTDQPAVLIACCRDIGILQYRSLSHNLCE